MKNTAKRIEIRQRLTAKPAAFYRQRQTFGESLGRCPRHPASGPGGITAVKIGAPRAAATREVLHSGRLAGATDEK